MPSRRDVAIERTPRHAARARAVKQQRVASRRRRGSVHCRRSYERSASSAQLLYMRPVFNLCRSYQPSLLGKGDGTLAVPEPSSRRLLRCDCDAVTDRRAPNWARDRSPSPGPGVRMRQRRLLYLCMHVRCTSQFELRKI